MIRVDVNFMSYLVLARKYRPKRFSEVEGQDPVIQTLKNAIEKNRVGHALIFAGLRGVGKTSVARILAHALNCKEPVDGEPCLNCPNCKEISSGRSFAVQEIDGASHNGVDTIRELIEHFRTPPPPGYKFKIYVIDEVHMLSLSAFNALLKSLEEPPPHTIFILATTEIHKIPETVLSRCQRYDFKGVSIPSIEKCLKEIAKSENVIVEPGVFRIVARMAEGSVRDAQTIFDRLIVYSQDVVKEEDAVAILGVTARASINNLAGLVLRREPREALRLFSNLCNQGIDIGILIKDFAAHLRELLLLFIGAKDILKEEGFFEEELVELSRNIAHLSLQDLQELERIGRQGCDLALRSISPRFAFEALLVRMGSRVPVEDITRLLERAPLLGEKPKEKPVLTLPKKNPKPIGNASLDWRSFVSLVEEKGNRMLSEHLKRLTVEEFSKGYLRASAPEFVVAYCNKEKVKILEALKAFDPETEWTLELTVANLEGSLVSEEVDKMNTESDRETSNLLSHPKLKQIHEIFPGTQIEGAE